MNDTRCFWNSLLAKHFKLLFIQLDWCMFSTVEAIPLNQHWNFCLLFCFCQQTLASDTDDLIAQLLSVSQAGDETNKTQGKQAVSDALIKTIVQSYCDNLDQAGTLLQDTNDKATQASTKTTETHESDNTVSSSSQNKTSLVTSPLRIGHLQTSGSLQGAHLADYPALPDVDPTASILSPTPAQLARKKELDDLIRQRKLFLMEHPVH